MRKRIACTTFLTVMLFFQPPGILRAQDISGLVETRVQGAIERSAAAFRSGAVAGHIIERAPGSYIFSPDDRSLAIVAISNPERVGTLSVGPPVVAHGVIDTAARSLTLAEYEIADIADAARSPGPPDTDSALAKARGAAGRILTLLNDASQPGAQSVESRSLDRNTPLGTETLKNIDAFATAYRDALAAGDTTTVDAIVALWRKVRTTITEVLPDGTEYQAVYGAPDYYRPWRYDRIFSESPATVAIGEPGKTRARCSGVLIAEDLVLTAGHCFAGPPPKEPGELEIWFDYIELPDGTTRAPVRRKIDSHPVAPEPAVWPSLMNRQFSNTLYDYAIVRFTAPDGQPLIPVLPPRRDGDINKPKPQCLRQTPLARADAVYVVGYPRGEPATVHDAGRVELPFREQQGDRFDLLRLEVAADFTDELEQAQVLREFDQSYIPDNSGFLKWYYLFDVRDGGQPRMGIVADTFRGNSGGPVYDHEGHQCVVGILNRGMGDTGSRLSANWKVHERVLPMTAILNDLRKNAATAALIDGGTLSVEQ